MPLRPRVWRAGYTPHHAFMLDDLALLFPTAQFVHIVRHPAAVVRSMLAFGQRPGADHSPLPDWSSDFAAARDTWCRSVQAASAFGRRRPDRLLTVANESLSADPEGGFRDVLRFLRLPEQQGPARLFAGRRYNSSFPAGSRPQSGLSTEQREALAEDQRALARRYPEWPLPSDTSGR